MHASVCYFLIANQRYMFNLSNVRKIISLSSKKNMKNCCKTAINLLIELYFYQIYTESTVPIKATRNKGHTLDGRYAPT